MKLLLDENLSVRIISRVADLFPDSTHIKAIGLREADDFVVWEWAKKHGVTPVLVFPYLSFIFTAALTPLAIFGQLKGG